MRNESIKAEGKRSLHQTLPEIRGIRRTDFCLGVRDIPNVMLWSNQIF